jgi:hypothetical protein
MPSQSADRALELSISAFKNQQSSIVILHSIPSNRKVSAASRQGNGLPFISVLKAAARAFPIE